MPCQPTHFPRHEIDRKRLGDAVRKGRTDRKWSRSALARRVGVTRQTIARLEQGETTPGVQLVRALEHPTVLGGLDGVGWLSHAPDPLPAGFLAHLARRASGQTLREVAKKLGCSVATLSDFERNVLSDSKILGVRRDAVSRGYAKALGFEDAADMVAYLNARDASPWLDRISAKFRQARLVNALRPSVRPVETLREIDLR